jgi:hypothetical protein
MTRIALDHGACVPSLAFGAPIPDAAVTTSAAASELDSRFKAVRSMTRSLAASLSAEDQMVQSCPEASPVKWHQAHTTWFFETFVLRPFLAGYELFREDFRWLFNSYYNSLGEEIPEKKLRASFSRPSLEEVLAFRAHVDEGIERLLAGQVAEEASRRMILGLHHEQQHEELALTDIKHAFYTNPLRPAYSSLRSAAQKDLPSLELKWHSFDGGLVEIGYSLDATNSFDFCFDNETPRHKVYLEPFQIASRMVTCREYLDFIADGAYSRSEFWLSEGWDMVRQQGWQAPLYWEPDPADETGWRVFTLYRTTLAMYIGSSIGNFSPEEARRILRNLGSQLQPGDALLLGTDKVKDESALVAAYDDRDGVTAAFNVNILRRLNRELGADFNLDNFRHRAIWNRVESRIEMHLESTCDQEVCIESAQLSLHFTKSETIHTENSYKFTSEAICILLEDAGFDVERTWMDDRGWYAVTLARIVKERSQYQADSCAAPQVCDLVAELPDLPRQPSA